MNIFNKKEQKQKEEQGLYSRLKNGLSKTRKGFVDKIGNLFSGNNKIDDKFFEKLEEILIQADVGIDTTLELVENLKHRTEEDNISSPEILYKEFQERIFALLQHKETGIHLNKGLNIITVVGVNGSGKTTTIAKIAGRFKERGKKVMLAAGDTFRAGAIDQLKTWAERLNVNFISQEEGSDAAAVAYDAVHSARARDIDLLIVDTAGRLHTQKNLMKELKKVKRIIDQEGGRNNNQVLLVLDATTGQNALSQARLFNEAVNVDGIALTKLDGTARGGIVIAIKNELGIPIKLIGVGEEAADLQNFEAEKFVKALFSE